MLVVIAIIGILVALIMPGIGRAKEKARAARCKNNLRNLQIGAMNYAIDQDDGTTLPSSGGWIGGSRKWWSPEGTNAIQTGIGVLFPYVGSNFAVYVCPSFARREIVGAVSPDGLDPFDWVNVRPVRSYAMNSRISGTTADSWSRLLLFADVAHTNQLPDGTIICDRGLLNNNSLGWDEQLSMSTNPGTGRQYESTGFLHGGRGNVVFADGHVESMLWSETYAAWLGQR